MTNADRTLLGYLRAKSSRAYTNYGSGKTFPLLHADMQVSKAQLIREAYQGGEYRGRIHVAPNTRIGRPLNSQDYRRFGAQLMEVLAAGVTDLALAAAP